MRILVGTDLSERSQAALRRAVELAPRPDSHLVLVHVVDSELPPEIVGTQRERSQKWLTEHIPSDSSPRHVEVFVRAGDPHQELLAAADEHEVDLIVLGAHRRRPFLDAFMGTTVERLLRVSSRPVLVVHNKESTARYRRVLAAIDLSASSASALRSAERLGFLAGLTTVIHVFYAGAKGKLQQVGIDPASHIEAERAAAAAAVDVFLKDIGLSKLRSRVLLREGRAAHEIRSLVTEMTPDLLVLGAKGLTGVKRAVLGSITEALMRSVPCDVLVVPVPTEGQVH